MKNTRDASSSAGEPLRADELRDEWACRIAGARRHLQSIVELASVRSERDVGALRRVAVLLACDPCDGLHEADAFVAITVGAGLQRELFDARQFHGSPLRCATRVFCGAATRQRCLYLSCSVLDSNQLLSTDGRRGSHRVERLRAERGNYGVFSASSTSESPTPIDEPIASSFAFRRRFSSSGFISTRGKTRRPAG
jgi:hypothetical protein